ncbi:MAG TPA: hypothetical protein VGS22_19045 [Thermoanaerobaculia bacterium]|jgi:hypothetical protein|nr:hypothetical protein [Thermoanaerobaculia bacterium]
MLQMRCSRSLIAVLVVVCLATAGVAALAHHHGHGAVRLGARCASCHFAHEAASAGLTIPAPVVSLARVGAVAEPATTVARVVSVSSAPPRAPPFA